MKFINARFGLIFYSLEAIKYFYNTQSLVMNNNFLVTNLVFDQVEQQWGISIEPRYRSC